MKKIWMELSIRLLGFIFEKLFVILKLTQVSINYTIGIKWVPIWTNDLMFLYDIKLSHD